MKHIIKSSEPVEFTNWKSANPNATYADLSNPGFPGSPAAKGALRTSLLQEQHGLCCYCESLITSGNYHIEHFRPKARTRFPELQLEYDNLHASCHIRPTGGADECCGHKKSDDFSPDLVSPLDTDCSSHFSFDLNGNISSSDTPGDVSIRMLNLNSSLLKSSRKALIDFFFDLEDDERPEEINRHLDTTRPVHGEYFSTIKFLSDNGLL